MPRYIDADILPKLFDEEYKKTRKLIEDGETHLDNLAEGFSEAARVVTFVSLTTADVQEVIHAKFELVNNGKGVCSNCHRLDSIDNLAKYCRYCGALMDGKDVEDRK